MKKTLLLLALAGAFTWVSSCTSVPYSRWNSSAEKAVDLVSNTGDAYTPRLTSRPFLLDGEIIMLERDTDMIWRNLYEAGFKFSNVKSTQSMPVRQGDYTIFADTMEVETYFEKYLSEDDSLVKIEAENGLYYLILGSRKWIRIDSIKPETHTRDSLRGSYPVIHGFTGPVRR